MGKPITDVYKERSMLLGFVSKVFPSMLGPATDQDDDPEFNWIVYIFTPKGQLSWHISDNDLLYFSHVRRSVDPIDWDGHSTEEKYERIRFLEKDDIKQWESMIFKTNTSEFLSSFVKSLGDPTIKSTIVSDKRRLKDKAILDGTKEWENEVIGKSND